MNELRRPRESSPARSRHEQHWRLKMASLARGAMKLLANARDGNVLRLFSNSTFFLKERPSTESLIQWQKLPSPKKQAKEFWSEKRALFGENDYKDILGDGTYALRKNVKTGPWWVRGWKGNELQMLIRKRNIVGHTMGPETRHNMHKRIKYLYKQMNRNKGKGYYYGDR